MGRSIHRKRYEALSAVLTQRSLEIEKGVPVVVQESVPLDKVTDPALVERPLLKHSGPAHP